MRTQQHIIERARERLAEYEAWMAEPWRTRKERYAEFCGSFGELLAQLADSIEIPASLVHDWDAEAAERELYADVMAADLADQRDMDGAGG